MSKRVLFVAGANHSGSTLVGCILGAREDLKHFHVGEIHAYFKKGGKNFGNPKAAKRLRHGDTWDRINAEVGYEGAYTEIFNQTEAEVIIDSSKTPRNLSVAIEACKEHGYPLHVVMTYRPFEKIWASDINRDKDESHCLKNITNYHISLEQLRSQNIDLTVVATDDLIANPAAITEKLCRAVGLPYFEGKEKYWEYPSCHLYGSKTQRIHMKNPESAGYDKKKLKSNKATHNEMPDSVMTDNITSAYRFLAENAIKV